MLAYDFAYGSGGDKLRGKKLLVATTTGGPAAAYQAGGYNQYTLSELLRPLQATANLAGMAYQPVFSTSGVLGLGQAELDSVVGAYQHCLAAL